MRRSKRPVVLDAEESEHLPADVYIPIKDLAADGSAMVELHEMIDRRTALLVYSSIARLFAGWGEHRSAMRLPADELPALRRTLHFHALLLDVAPLAERTTQSPEPLPLAAGSETGDPLVYAPSRPFPNGSDHAELELQRTEDGKKALMTYSSRAVLLRCCGRNQHFVSFPVDRLADVFAESGADAVLIDLPLPDRLRH